MKSTGCLDVWMSSIQVCKTHKQEGTLVSKVHKQGTLGTPSQASLHQWLHNNLDMLKVTTGA